MTNPIVAIGLDAADPVLLEEWLDAGHLPNLAKMRSDGGYGRLENIDHYKAETPWTTFLTGCMPKKTGYEVCRELRSSYSLLDLPIIGLVNHKQTKKMLDALNLGANDCIVIPMSAAVAKARIKNLLTARQLYKNATTESTVSVSALMITSVGRTHSPCSSL